jgi:hypothetical protein
VYRVTVLLDFPLTYRDRYGGYWRTRKSFDSDLGSIPPAAQIVIPKDSAIRAFLFHDDAYDQHALLFSLDGWTYRPRPISRAEADDLLRETMAEDGLDGWRGAAAFRAVRAFGGGAWASHKQAGVKP